MGLNGRRRLQWGHPFFGLTQEYKVHLHELIFDLTYFGKIEYFAVYEMPVQYRSFYLRKLVNIQDKEKASIDKSMSKQDAPSSSNFARGPGISRG